MKRSCHPFLLNLPLIFADSDSSGFTVTRRDEKRFLWQCPLNKIKTSDDKSIPPCRSNGGIPIAILVTLPLAFVAHAPVSTIALKAQNCWKTRKHMHSRQFRRLSFLTTLQNASLSPFCIFACCPACHKGLNSRMQNRLVFPLT